ncbi:MAG: DMT family transporter [Mollicutes bacterium PWAP]|nr:DMT family transporter [Mollicutes bacterium PWAP]
MNKTKNTKIIKKNRKFGISMSFSVLFLQGLEGFLLPLFGILTFTILIDVTSPIFSIIYSIIKEVVISLIMIVSMPVIFIKSTRFLKNKIGLFVLIAGALGTFFGNIFYILAISIAGSGYGSTLTSFYPIFTLFLSFIIFKEKTNWKVFIGIGITILGGALFVLLPSLIESQKVTPKVILGMFFGMISGAFWAVETIFVKKSMIVSEKKNLPIKNLEIISIRTLGVLISTVLISLPISFAFGDSPLVFKSILTSYQVDLLIIGISIFVFLLRFVHILSIYHVGVRVTSSIDTNNFLIPALLSFIFQYFGGEIGTIYSQEAPVWWSLLLFIPIAIGVFLVVFFSEKEKDPKEKNSFKNVINEKNNISEVSDHS